MSDTMDQENNKENVKKLPREILYYCLYDTANKILLLNWSYLDYTQLIRTTVEE